MGESDVDARVALLADEERMAELTRLGSPHLQGPDPRLDLIAVQLARICDAPVSAVNFVTDTLQICGGSFGAAAEEFAIGREHTMANVTIQRDSVVTFTDTGGLVSPECRLGRRGLVYYAGYPVITSSHVAVGTVCVLDYVPRRLTSRQATALTHAASRAAVLLERRDVPAQRIGLVI